jgi:hypothetical protein
VVTKEEEDMEGLLLESLAAERRKDIDREIGSAHYSRKIRRPRRPAGSWVLSGAMATWLR